MITSERVRYLRASSKSRIPPLAFKTGVFTAVANGFQDDVGGADGGGDFGFAGGGFDKTDVVAQAKPGSGGNGRYVTEGAGFQNDFGGLFGGFATDDFEKTAAFVKIAGQKIAVREHGVDFVGTAAERFLISSFICLKSCPPAGKLTTVAILTGVFFKSFLAKPTHSG